MGGVAGLRFRVITVLLAAIISWLGIISQAEALPLPSTTVPCAAFTYDDVTQSASTTDGATERGPPANYDYISVNDPVDRWFGGTTAHPDELAPRSTTTYTTPAEFVQVAWALGTTLPGAGGDVGTFPSLAPSRVAANTGQKWAYRGVGRNHPGYDDAMKGRVNPRNPNGTATPEQHNLGNTTDSSYTSWTRDPAIARRFAGEDGVVLRVPRGGGSPYKFEWSPDVYYEQEILIRGPVCGALIC